MGTTKRKPWGPAGGCAALDCLCMLQGQRGSLLCMQDPDSAERMWVLKTTAHRGQGVSVLPQQQAITAVLASSAEEDATAEMVQEYKSEQYTVAGRRFYLRCGRTWCSPVHQVGYARRLHCDAAYLIPLHDQILLSEILANADPLFA